MPNKRKIQDSTILDKNDETDSDNALIILRQRCPELRGVSKNLIVNLAFLEFCQRRGVPFKLYFKNKRLQERLFKQGLIRKQDVI